MDGKGGCCIVRYGGGTYDISTVDSIMMRFRPIAPKPANAGPSPEISEASPKSGRGKRRLTTTNGNNNRRCNNSSNNRKRKGLSEEKVDAVVTLPLLPETPDIKESAVDAISPTQTKKVGTWLSFGNNANGCEEMMRNGGLRMGTDRAVVNPQPIRVVIGSCVMVECITDTWVDVDGLGCTDKERKVNLERDSCPGFISDGFGTVTWTNEAYKKMVGQGEEVVVWLVVKDKDVVVVALGSNQAFTCRVKVQNQRSFGTGKEKSSITVPCDVWRMDSGGFAWRLDVKAALSLGR